METDRIRVKYGKNGREVVRDRGGGQTHTGDGSCETETRFTRSENTH